MAARVGALGCQIEGDVGGRKVEAGTAGHEVAALLRRLAGQLLLSCMSVCLPASRIERQGNSSGANKNSLIVGDQLAAVVDQAGIDVEPWVFKTVRFWQLRK